MIDPSSIRVAVLHGAGYGRSDLPEESGDYTLLLPSDGGAGFGQPGGHGYGTMKVAKGGMVSVSAVLGDGTRFTARAVLSAGGQVALVSSGDPGIYAMATLVFELLDQENDSAWNRVALDVVRGGGAGHGGGCGECESARHAHMAREASRGPVPEHRSGVLQPRAPGPRVP